jgi:hypothetical protein
MVEEAQNQVDSRLDDQSVAQAARERARAIIAEAEQQGAALIQQTNQYAVSQLGSLENRLFRLLREVQAGQHYLAQGGNLPESSGTSSTSENATSGDAKSTHQS